MFSTMNVLLAAACASLVVAAPTELFKRDDSITDITILQYATVLEHLENNFYSGALAKFDKKAFKKAGFADWVRGRFEQIAEHEASHVAFLTGALGSAAPQPCEYSFPYTDPKSFAALSMILEGVGTSAYLGAAKYIKNPDYLTAAGSILTVEARHDAWIGSAVNKGAAWDTAYGTPLGLSGVYSLASQFITSCPSGNPSLPVTTYPALSLSPAAPAPGGTVSVTVQGASPAYIAFFSGLNVLYAPITNGQATIPAELNKTGIVYLAAVKDNSPPTDMTMMSGLAILDFGFDSKN